MAEPMTLPTDVALAWSSLERAKAVLRRLENGLEDHPAIWRSRRLKGIQNGESIPNLDTTVSKDPPARQSPPSSTRMDGDFLKRQDVTWPSSPAAGCLPSGRDSDSRRTHAQQDPCLAMPSSTLSGRRLEGVEEWASGPFPLSFAGPAVGLEKKISHHQTALPPDSAASVLGNCRLAWQLQGLKENSPKDQKLQALKGRILEQRIRHLSRHLLRGSRLDLGSFARGSMGRQHPLKRKVCKQAVATATTAVESRGLRGRAPRMRKRSGPSHVAPTPGKDRKERGAHPFGVSAWREGQRLARKILGPLLELPKQRSSLEEQVVAKLATSMGAAPCQVMSAPPQDEERSKQRKGDNACRTTGTGQAGDVHPRRHRGPKGQDLGMEADQQSRPVSRKDMARPNSGSDIVQPAHLSEILDVPVKDPGKSFPGSNPLNSPTSGKENQVNGDSQVGCKRHPYSPEEVRKFMIKKMAERRKRSREAKWASDQAREERRRRLQEVYRKQRAAVSRKRSRVEDPQLVEGVSSVTLGKQDRKTDQGYVNDGPPDTVERIRQALDALLRNEPLGSSSRYSPKTARKVKSRHSPSSPATKGGVGSPLQLMDLATCSHVPQCSQLQNSFLLPSRPLKAPEPTCPMDRSLVRSTRDRVRAVESLAQELSTRVESAMASLLMAMHPMDCGKVGSPVRSGRVVGPANPREASKAGIFPVSISRCSFTSPSAGEPKSQLRTGDEEEVTVVQTTSEGGLCSFLAGTTALPGRSSSKEKTCAVCTRGLKGMHEGGASVPEFPITQVLTPEKGRTGSWRPATMFISERADPYVALCQNSRVENHPEKWPDKPDLKKTPEVGVQPGRYFQLFHEQETSELSRPMEKRTYRKATFPEESGDGSEATSQWSEVDLFYGSSGTFCRFGLTMAEQNLREEELSARHQSALLRLREKALQERVRAELALMEQRIRLEGVKDASIAVEKQDQVVTNLKQEQAEIRHLQNVCRAAHQRRKLLLKQHKELLEVRESTTRLWQQICPRGGTPQRQADAGIQTSFEGKVAPEKEESTEASGPTRDITMSSGAGNTSGLLPARDDNNIHMERAEISSPRRESARRCPQQESRPEPMLENLHPRRGQTTSPPPLGVTMMGTADQEVKRHNEDPGPKDPKEDPGFEDPKTDQCHASFNKEHAPHMSLGSLNSEAPFDASSCSSPEMRSFWLDSEFHKVHAVLVNISGSSPTTSDLEAEATDISLPEEFVFQESPHENCGSDLSGPPLPVDPGDPSVVMCDDSQVDGPGLQGQEKPHNDTGTYQCDTAVSAHGGKQRSNSPCTGGSLFLQADVTPDGSLDTLELLPCVENCRGNEMAIQECSQSVTGALVENRRMGESEIQRKQSPTFLGKAKRDANIGQHRSYPNTDVWPIEYLHEVSLKDKDSISDSIQDVGDQMQPFQSHASKELSIPDPAPSVPVSGKGFQTLNSKESQVFVSNEPIPEMEGDIRSPVDEVLTYGSADLPSPDVSVSRDSLPAPPEDLSERDEGSGSTLRDFPSPPDELLFSETAELEYSMDDMPEKNK